MNLWLKFFIQIFLAAFSFSLIILLVSLLLIAVYIKLNGGTINDIKENTIEFSKHILSNIKIVFKKEE